MTAAIGFVGFGRFGCALGARFLERGIPVRAYDPENPPPDEIAVASAVEVAQVTQRIFIAVPVMRTAEALRSLGPGLTSRHLVMDVGSVKSNPMAAMAEILGRQVPWIGTHPLFGPTSLAMGEGPLRVVVCPSSMHPGALKGARDVFSAIGCQVIQYDAETHDELMAESHALTYFLAKAILDAGLRFDSSVAPPSARAIARAVEAVQEDAGHLFASLHRENPFAAPARKRLLEALQQVDSGLRRPIPAGEEPHREPMSLEIPDLGEESPLLREARDLIDDLDERLIGLLAQRAQLARRAAAAKSRIGHGTQDVRREAELLESRRRRALGLGLDPAGVEGIFQAILRFSRKIQSSP